MSQRRQLKQTLTGNGTVYEGNKPICEVQYRLDIFQEYQISRSLTSTQEIPGREDISGRIEVISGDRDLATDNPLVLKLKDGRKWKFLAPIGNPVLGDYQVQSVGEGIMDE